MARQFSETAPGGVVSGRKTVRRQARGLVLEYEFSSTAGEPVSVRLSDRVPSGRTEESGFHEDHEPTEWTLSDGHLEMRVHLDPGAERTVVFGLVADEDEPTIDRSEPSVAVDVAGADEPGAPEEDGAGGPEDDGGAEDDGAFFDREGGSSDGGVDDTGGGSAGSVVSTLVDELEAGTVPESELATLRDHLGVERPEDEAARLEYVQKRLGDFDAYVNALEELLDVHGSGEDVVTELEERLDGVADDVAAVRQRQDEVADRVAELAAAVDAHAETVESLQVAHEEDVAEVRSELRASGEPVCEELDELRRSVDDDLAGLEAEVEALESIRRTLVDGLQRPEAGTGSASTEPTEPDADDGDPGASNDADWVAREEGTEMIDDERSDVARERPDVNSEHPNEASERPDVNSERPDEGFASPVLDEDADEEGDRTEAGVGARQEARDDPGDEVRNEARDGDGLEEEGAPEMDFEVSEFGAADGGDGNDGGEVDDNGAEVTAEEDDEGTDVGNDGREEGRGTSTFDIGDGDPGAEGDGEKPAIDFEDG